jgi:putative heme transporter
MAAEAERFPKSLVTVKTVFTAGVTALGLMAAVWVLIHGHIAVGLTLGSALLAIALNHAVQALVRRRWRRGPAIAAVMTGVFAFFVGLGLLLIPPAVGQARELVNQAPSLISQARHTRLYDSLNQRFQLDEKWTELQRKTPALAQQAVDPALKAVTGVLAGVTAFITVYFLIAFMLLFGGKLVNAVLRESTPERRPRYERVVQKVYRSIGGYIGGLSFICLVNAVLSTGVFALLRLPFFLPIGIATGLSSLIPLAGNTLAGIGATLIALATGGVWKAVAVAAWSILYQQFENHVLGPLVYRKTVNVNPLVIIVALLFMSELFGVLGAVLAVPLVAAGQIVLREVLAFRRENLNLPAHGPTESALGADAPE